MMEQHSYTQLGANETYAGKSVVAQDQNGDCYNFGKDGKISKFDSNATVDETNVVQVVSNWETTPEDERVLGDGSNNALTQELGVALVISQSDSPIPGPADILATMVAIKAIYQAFTGGVTVSEQTLEFAQRGSNNGRLQDDELESILARKAAGEASSSDLQKLKKHEKNTGQRNSRQSKDKK